MTKRMREIAIITLLCFCWTILLPGLLPGQEPTGLDNARRLYKEGRLDKAKEALDALVAQWSGKPESKQSLAEAYFLRAKIFLEVLENAKCEEDLRQLFMAKPNFPITGDDPELKTLAERIRLETAQNRQDEIKKAQELLKQEQENARLEAAQKAEEQRNAAAQKKIDDDQKLAEIRSKIDEQEKADAIKKTESNLTTATVEKEGQPVIKNKKSFPWLLVVLGGAAVVLLIVLLAGSKSSSTPTTPVVTTGSIQVNSTPTGAKIYLDGNDTGKTTNSLITNISAGSHDIKLTLSGYLDYTATCTVTVNQIFMMNANILINPNSYKNGVLTVGGVHYDMVSIPSGTFQMGSNSSSAWDDERPMHTVTISAFYMGKTEVTQGLWKVVMGINPSHFKSAGDTNPVEEISWNDCQAFVTKLNQLIGGTFFRMPTEAEWEYACRAGTTGDRYGNLDNIAWYHNNSGGTTHPVCQKQANAWGLYDMLGNVWEWCSDWYGPYSSASQVDPQGPSAGTDRIFRGGGWSYDAGSSCSAFRYKNYPYFSSDAVGFRLAANSAGN